MIKQQNIQLLYPNLQESQQLTVLKAYENETLQQFHAIVLQIKTKYAIPNSLNAIQFPNQDEVIEFFQNYRALILDLNQIADVKIKLYKNAAYYGSLVDGLRQGQGVLIKQTLQIYEGSWVRDKKEGIGIEILKSNQFYHGNYVNGLPHGEGVFWSKNQKYIGQWQQGKKVSYLCMQHGIGWYSGAQKDYYLGQWENGRCFGLCLHILQDIYIGYVTNDLKHGQGEEYFENGDHFVGEYKNGKPNGYGEYKWSNGNFYKGQFVNGLRNGEGVWQNQTREGMNCYKGQYANDKKCGQGTFEYANGTSYNGYFVDDKRCGYGEMVWSDQATYKGYWQEGLMEGEGIYNFDGLILKGNWKQNQLQSFDKVRVSLNEFPIQHQIKKIKENEDVYSQMAEEPDQDEIGEQFQNDALGSKVETVTQNISHNTSHHDMQFQSNKPQILQKQFDLLSLLDQGLQLQSIDPPQRQCSSVAIQTDSKKQFLPKLSIHKKTPTQYSYSVDPRNRSNKFDSYSNSPNTRETDKSTRTQPLKHRSVQCRGRKNKQILLSKKEQNIWAIKMNKLKLSPTRYCKLWNHEVLVIIISRLSMKQNNFCIPLFGNHLHIFFEYLLTIQMQQEIRKKEYLNYLTAECQKILITKDMKILNFLYKVIFDEKYYHLTRILQYPEHFLNYEIGRIILYPYENYLVQNTTTAITLIPAFVSFYTGQSLILHEFLKVDVDNIWDLFLTGIAHRINGDIDQGDTYIERFLHNLEKESKSYLAIDLEKTLSFIDKYINSKEMLKLLNLMFFQDCLMFVVNSKDVSNGYLQFLAEKKKLIIRNTFQYLQKYVHEIGQQIEFYKMKVAISFLENNYDFSYICPGFDHLQAGMVIFSLIQLDYKQFQYFYSILSNDIQIQFLNQIVSIAGNQEAYFYRLLLVGKCLSKLRCWEDAINIFNLLLKQIANHPNKDQFKMYINFKLCKISFLQGQTEKLLRKLNTVSQMIDQYKERRLDFFQTNPQKSIQNHCWFLQLLLSVYYNDRDRMRTVLIKISNITIHTDSINQRRAFTLLQYEFIKLINHFGAVLRDQGGERQLARILKEIQSMCLERQYKSYLFGFFKKEKKINNNYSIPNYFQAVEEILIINVLLRKREIYMLQYLNPKFYPLIQQLLKSEDFFETSLQAQICFFLHDFDKALQLALKIKDSKLIGQIYEYQNRFDEAIEQYRQVLSPSCFFNCAILQRYKKEFSTAYEGFKNLEQSQNQYHLICQMFKDDLRKKQNLCDISERTSKDYTEISSQQFKSQKSVNLTNSVRVRNKSILLDGEPTSETTVRSSNELPNQVESLFETSDFTHNDSQEQQPDHIKQLVQRFVFPLRGDIEFFYINLAKDLTTEKSSLWNTLGDFVEKTKHYEIDSIKLFEKGYPNDLIGKGGNGEVHRFEFQQKIYAAKKLTISYDGTGENTSDEQKLEIEKKLIEICILCDTTKSNIKYVIKLRHIGFKFERLGNTAVLYIYLLTDLYQQHHIMQTWDIERKIKYAFKLSRALYSLQSDLRILHLDLKPDNVLVNQETFSPVIIDFGLSKKFTESIRGQPGLKECTYRYLDPDLLKRNFSSRKNDVYSFGASLYQYITNNPPFKELNDYQLVGLEERFSVYHETQIEQIKNEFIRQLIKDCVCPIETRITFLEVLGRFFQYYYKPKVESVRQLIAMLFDHYYQQQKLQKKVQLHILLLKQFVKRSNEFTHAPIPNQQAIVFKSTYNQFSDVFVEIIQRIKQFVNWVKLAPIKGVNKLIDFEIHFSQIEKVCKNIEFVFYIQSLPIVENLTKEGLVQIAKILQTIHEQHICLLIVPRECIYQKDQEILLGNLSFSQDLSIETDNLYYLNYELIDPSIQKTKQFDFSNDIYAFGKLLRATQPELAERCLQTNITLEQIIEILN